MNLNIIKQGKSKYGHYLQLEDKSFKGSTEAVNGFLDKQIPCTIEVVAIEGEGKAEKISRVKVLGKESVNNSQNEFEAPVETVQPGKLVTESVKPQSFDSIRQNSIECQMSIKTAVEMIGINNACDDFEKMRPTKDNIFQTAKIVLEVLKDLKNL